MFSLALLALINHLPQLGIELSTSLFRTQLAPDSATHPVEGSVKIWPLSQEVIKTFAFFRHSNTVNPYLDPS
jgi:hypothetical protein